MIVIVDYNVGNLHNLKNALDYQDIPNRIATRPEELDDASHMIFPGVGAFRPAIDHLREAGMEQAVLDFAASGRPFLGICIGMQLMFETGHEDGSHKGLGLIGGEVVRFTEKGLKIPQIGWNEVAFQREDPLFQGISDHSFFYFVHSYHARLRDQADALGLAEYGEWFPAIVRRKNMWGVQFHPEKSQDAGLRLLKNFSITVPE